MDLSGNKVDLDAIEDPATRAHVEDALKLIQRALAFNKSLAPNSVKIFE